LRETKKHIKRQKLQHITTKEILTSDFEGTNTSQRQLICKLVQHVYRSGEKTETKLNEVNWTTKHINKYNLNRKWEVIQKRLRIGSTRCTLC